MTDLLQIDFSQRPFRKMNICEKVYSCFKNDPDEKSFSRKIHSIRSNFDGKIDSFLENVDNLVMTESPLRAEFRMPLNRVLSMTNLLDLYLNDTFIKKHSIILGALTVVRLMKFWTKFLTQPINNTMSKLVIFCGEKSFSDEKLFNSYLTNISAFESILTETFVNGTTRSSIPEILWKSSTSKTGNGKASLNLMKGIKELNRLNFKGTSWSDVEREICGTSQLLTQIETSRKFRFCKHLSLTFKLIQELKLAINYDEKANLLWDSYFNYLWSIKPDDFYKETDANDRMKLGHLKAKLRVRVTFDHKQAVENVFNLERLDSAKNVNSTTWNTPFLVAYEYASKHPIENNS